MQFKKPIFWDKKFSVWKYFLLPLSYIYFFLSKINFKKKNTVNGIFSICVGNIYLGGTGKTPSCLLLKKILERLDIKSCFIKKNYSNQIDEQNLLSKYGDLFVEKIRLSALIKSKNQGYKVAIFDDGFQDKSINYNLKIVCFNSENFIGNGNLIPSGPLREKISAVKSCDAVFLNGLSLNNKKNIDKLKTINPSIKVFETIYKMQDIENLDKSAKYLIFAGISNPINFFNLLKNNNINIVKKIFYADHYIYNEQDIEKIRKISVKENLKIITTEKDYCRLNKSMREDINYIKIELSLQNENEFIDFLKNKI